MRVLYFLCKLAMSKMMAGNIAFPSLILRFSSVPNSMFLRSLTDFAPTLVRRIIGGTTDLHRRRFGRNS